MLDDLAYDDSEPPAIGLVPAGVSWDEVQDHIKIAHSPLLVGPGPAPAPPQDQGPRRRPEAAHRVRLLHYRALRPVPQVGPRGGPG